MLSSRNIIFGVLLLLIIALVLCSCGKDKSREHYNHLYYNKDLDNSMLSRPTFNSNLDPNNKNLRFDPNVYGGYIKGTSPDVGNLASTNKISTVSGGRSREGFAPVGDQTQGPMNHGEYMSGVNDAGAYTTYSDADYNAIPNDFSSMGSEGTFQSAQNAEIAKYKSSLNNKTSSGGDTLKYTVPSELLPAPDMRNGLARDPSDPSNFMYDRTVFAPLKKRNHNEADRFRGDLSIDPIKGNWFSVASVPSIDLVKGYFGYYNDIQEYNDLQDVSYARARDNSLGQDSSTDDAVMNKMLGNVNQRISKLNPAYATQPPLNSPIGNSADNPWSTKRAFAL